MCGANVLVVEVKDDNGRRWPTGRMRLPVTIIIIIIRVKSVSTTKQLLLLDESFDTIFLAVECGFIGVVLIVYIWIWDVVVCWLLRFVNMDLRCRYLGHSNDTADTRIFQSF